MDLAHMENEQMSTFQADPESGRWYALYWRADVYYG